MVQPEGAAASAAGEIYVADRDRGVVLRLDGDGRMLDNVRVARPRALAVDESDHLWVGSDGAAEAPWQAGPGAIWRVSPRGEPASSSRARWRRPSRPARPGCSSWPTGRAAEIFALTADGGRTSLARFTDGDAPRGLAFVPATAETRAAGLAGDLLVAVVRSGAFQLNEIVRIAGPFADLTARPATPPSR